ncbi:MAG: SEL1-like repeat protein, partial [Oscillospiraceae bacterium]|nr:SEL1-like repeat protein [Oscillospiraceae bacterium]
MKCPHCGSQWNLAANIAPPKACPFCGKSLEPAKDTAWREVSTPQECFAWALDLMGRDGLREGGRVQGLFAETGDTLRREMGLVQAFLQCGGNTAFLDALEEDAPRQTLVRARIVETLVRDKWIAQPAAQYICDSFWFAITGSGTAVLGSPAPQPQPAPVPAPPAGSGLPLPSNWAAPATLPPPPAPPAGDARAELRVGSLGYLLKTAAGPLPCPWVYYELGDRYNNGRGIPQDLAKAAYWLHRAACCNVADAFLPLADNLQTGWPGKKPDPAAAVSWQEKAALGGKPYAMYRLAEAYKNGFGLPKDPNKYLCWLNKAADAGFADAMY